MSKKRPSQTGTVLPRRWAGRLTPLYWSQRLFKNSYVYLGELRRVRGWSVKIQHAGQRRTLSLAARYRQDAAREALVLYETILSAGWSAVNGPDGSAGAVHDIKRTPTYWRARLVRRQYTDWLRASREWSVCVEWDDCRHYFPLGTNSGARAAERAARIYCAVADEGWEAVCARFEREITLAIFWSSDPLAYTYTTLVTRVQDDKRLRTAGDVRTVWIIEPDPGVRAALRFWIDRQPAFGVEHVFGDADRALRKMRGSAQPDLVLINRLARVEGEAGADAFRGLDPSQPIFNYGVFEDSTQLFLCFGGVRGGYVLRRTRPEELLAPCGAGRPAVRLTAAHFQGVVKRYFQSFFESAPVGDDLPAFALLTEREKEILDALSKGFVDKEIAETLGISAWTVHSHLRNIFEKLHVRTRTQAVVRYLQK